MMKAFGILLGVLAIWVGAEVYLNGTHGAFGGQLAPFMSDPKAPAEKRASAPKRAGAAVERAHQEKQERYEDLLGE